AATPGTMLRTSAAFFHLGPLLLKALRQVEAGTDPDVELGTLLASGGSFGRTPEVAGHLEYVTAEGERTTLAVLKSFVPNEGSAWQWCLDGIGHYLEQVMTL